MDKEQRNNKVFELMMKYFDLDFIEKTLPKLHDMGFFDAPASTRFHGDYEGGLCDHSLEVTGALLWLTENLHLIWDRPESPVIVGLFHDLCKCDQYRKREDGTYEYVKDLPLTGHGEKSAMLASTLIQLTEEEMLCIRWHMGAYDDKENWNSLGSAIEKYHNVLFAHTADMLASRCSGV